MKEEERTREDDGVVVTTRHRDRTPNDRPARLQCRRRDSLRDALTIVVVAARVEHPGLAVGISVRTYACARVCVCLRV